jgi:hypothetical protein
MGLYIEFLLFADSLSPLKSLLKILVTEIGLLKVSMNRRQPGIGNRKVGIQFDRHLIKEDALDLLTLGALLITGCVCLQSRQ